MSRTSNSARSFGLLLVAAVLVLVTACSEPLPEDASGEEIYVATCAACHGTTLQGRSGPPLGGPEAPSAGEDRDYFILTVTKGRSRMPSWENRLSTEQIERVVDFVMAQQGR